MIENIRAPPEAQVFLQMPPRPRRGRGAAGILGSTASLQLEVGLPEALYKSDYWPLPLAYFRRALAEPFLPPLGPGTRGVLPRVPGLLPN